MSIQDATKEVLGEDKKGRPRAIFLYDGKWIYRIHLDEILRIPGLTEFSTE